MNRTRPLRSCLALFAALWLAAPAFAQGKPVHFVQGKQGPVRPPVPREKTRVIIQPQVEPPPIPVEEIVQRFTQKEDELKRAHDAFNYQISVRVQEFPADGTPGSEMQMLSEIYRKDDGQRYGRILKEDLGQMRFFEFFREDLQELAGLPLFVLTTEQLARYELTYAGRQPVDELNAYAFQVRPKRLERRERQFEGVVWVDDQDFTIVKTYGKWVTEVVPDATSIPFQMFETYRGIIADKYWFPIYVRSEDTVKAQTRAKEGAPPGKAAEQTAEARVRLTIRYADYKPAPPLPPAPPK